MLAASSNAETALGLARAGFAVFPCHPGGEKAKSPMPFIRWREVSSSSERQVQEWWKKWPNAAIGLDLAKSGLIVIDADRHDPEADGVEAFGALMAGHGFHPDSAPLVATPNAGNHHFFRQPSGKMLGNNRGTLPAGVDVRGAGGYVLAPGTVMEDGRGYELHGDLTDAPDLPDWLAEILQARHAPDMAISISTRELTTGEAEIEELLNCISPDVGYHDWLAALMAVHAATGGSGFDIADRWSAKGKKYPGSKELAKKWASFKRSGVSGRSLAMLARDLGNADLAEIALRHNPHPEVDQAEAAAAARRLIEAHDGTLHDAETGEIVEDVRPVEKQTAAPMKFPPGLVGHIAQWIVDTARRPQPELALGAALAIVGTAAGRQYAGPTKSGTHLYILCLAETGTGKDHPLQAISRVMTAARLGIHIGPSEFISMPAVINFLMRSPLSVCPMDEFGGFMKRINSKKASSFEGAISKIMRSMWSSSFAPYSTPEWAGKHSQMIMSPSMTLYGASTPEQFYTSMEGSALEDGTLNRFLLLDGHGRPAERDPEHDASHVPDAIVDAIRSIYNRSGEMAVTYRNDASIDPAAENRVRRLPWCADGSHARYKSFSAEVERIMERDHERGAFFARTAEMALRIATIIAIGRMDDDQVRLADLDFGIEVARRSAELMAAGAADYMADNENQANSQKVMRILRKRGRLKHGELVKAMQHTMRARDLRDLLGAMVDAAQIEKQEVKAQTGPPTYWYQMLV